MSRKTPPCGAPPPFLDLAHDAARDVIARQQFRRTPRVLVALRVTPAFFFVVGRLRFVVVRNVVEHETLAFAVRAGFRLRRARLRSRACRDARRPDHAGGMKLNELHVDQFRAGVIGERMAVAGAFPTVARDLVGSPDAAGRENDRFGAEKL